VLAAAALAGCGGGAGASSGSGAARFPRAAEPAESPPTRRRPAGAVAATGPLPEGLAFDSRAGLLAVGLRAPSRLGFLDPRTLRLRRAVPLPATPRHLAVAPGGGFVAVPAEAANELVEVSPRAGVLAAVPVGRHPHDAAFAAGRLFVADEHSDQVSVLRSSPGPSAEGDGAPGGRVIATLPAPAQPGGIAAAGRWVVLVAVAQRVLQIYDARTLRPAGRAAGLVGPTHVVTLGGDAFVTDTQGEAIREYRLGPRPRLLARVPARGTPYGLAVDRRRRRLWVTLTATNRLAEYGVAGGRPRRLATYPTVRQPNSVAVDPASGAVFVAGATPRGRIERIVPGNGGGP